MSEPPNCITEEEARELQNNWVATRAAAIAEAIGEEDGREVLFDLEELLQYLQYVKEKSEQQELPNPGVRVYFGAYNTEENKRATVFIAPTVDITSGCNNNYAIQPLNKKDSGWPPKSY